VYVYVCLCACESRSGADMVLDVLYVHAKKTDDGGNTLQHAATRCNTLQHAATCCNTLQHTAAY